MNKPVLVSLTAAGIFAAGYWCGKGPGAAETGRRKNGAVTSLLPVRPGGGQEPTHAPVFIPVHPFGNGGAEAWLRETARTHVLLPGSRGSAGFEMAQDFLTMDAACAKEVFEALGSLLTRPASSVAGGDPAFPPLEFTKRALGLAASRLAQLDPALAATRLQALPRELTGNLMTSVFTTIAREDPARAEEMLRGFGGAAHAEGLEGILGVLVQKDSGAAFEMMERYPGEAGWEIRDLIIENLIKSDPAKGVNAVAAHASNATDNRTLREVLGRWEEMAGASALAWAKDYQGPGSRTARAWLVEQHARTDPGAALTEFIGLQESGAGEHDLAPAAASLAQKLANKDLSAARDWTIHLPPGEIRDQALPPVVDAWTLVNPGEAARWIATLPVDQERDKYVRTLVSALTEKDPATAFEWARGMQDQDDRRHLMAKVFESWMEQDPEDARVAEEALPRIPGGATVP